MKKSVIVTILEVNDKYSKFTVNGFKELYEIKASHIFENKERWDESNIQSFIVDIIEGINHSGRLRILETDLKTIVADFAHYFPLEQFRENERKGHKEKMTFHVPLKAITASGQYMDITLYIDTLGEVL